MGYSRVLHAVEVTVVEAVVAEAAEEAAVLVAKAAPGAGDAVRMEAGEDLPEMETVAAWCTKIPTHLRT